MMGNKRKENDYIDEAKEAVERSKSPEVIRCRKMMREAVGNRVRISLKNGSSYECDAMAALQWTDSPNYQEELLCYEGNEGVLVFYDSDIDRIKVIRQIPGFTKQPDQKKIS